MKMRKVTMVLLLALCSAGLLYAPDGRALGGVTAGPEASPAVDCSKVDDAAISSSVREKLAQTASLKDARINVETSGGVVTLRGLVKNGPLKGVATRVTKKIDCVKKVDNQLSLEQRRGGPGAKGSKSTM